MYRTKHFVAAAIAAAGMFSASIAVADMNLARAKNCMACHAEARKLIGPSFKDIAAKYAGNGAAVALLAQKVRGGGSGVWGPVPMPANPQVSEAEAETLVKWILSTK